MIAYLIPFLIYTGTPALVGLFSKDPVLAYAARFLLTLPALVFFMDRYREIKISWDWIGPILGVLFFLIWTGLDPFYPKYFSKPEGLSPANFYWSVVSLKFCGMVILAPWVEELFFRSFLPRYIENPKNSEKIPAGHFTPASFLLSALLFGLLHSEWLAGFLMGLLLNWIYQRTKNLWPCIIAHAVTNLILWEEAIRTHNWNLW